MFFKEYNLKKSSYNNNDGMKCRNLEDTYVHVKQECHFERECLTYTFNYNS